jgi:hypothetical protein
MSLCRSKNKANPKQDRRGGDGVYEGDFVVSIFLSLIALVATGFLVSIAMGRIDMAKTERTWLAVLSGVVLASIAVYAVLS